jgi:hypothetical protein
MHAIMLPLEVDVLDAQLQGLQQPQPGAIEQLDDERAPLLHLGDHPPHFVDAQHDRQACGRCARIRFRRYRVSMDRSSRRISATKDRAMRRLCILRSFAVCRLG